MAGRYTWRRRAVTTIAVAVTALGMAACGGDDEPGGATPSGTSQLGDAPPASADPTGSPGPAAPTAAPTNGGNNGPVYPKGAKAYAQELLKAWAGPDYTRLGQLAIQSAVQQIRDSVDFGGKPNGQWTHIACGPSGAGFTRCVFRNAHGDEVRITMNDAQLGFPTAITEVPLERTEYPASPTTYVGNLLTAYRDGNQQRVLRLSNSTVKSQLTCAFNGSTGVEMIDGTYSKVTLTGLGVDLGKEYQFKVLTLPEGKAGAVKEVLSKAC